MILFKILYFAFWQSFVLADPITLCHRGASTTHMKAAQDYSPYAIRSLDYVRTLVECLTHCLSTANCITAVYQRSNACHLLHNQVASGVEDDSGGDHVAEFQLNGGCPAPCQGNSVCLLDCTNSTKPTPACVDVSQDHIQCNYPLNLSTVEYYFPEMDLETLAKEHVFFTVTFTKLETSTDLRVQFRGTLRGGVHANGGSGWWEIKFDGQSCSNPGKIQSLHSEQGSVNHHKASGINGVCKGLPKGSISISLIIEQDQPSDFRVGYATDATRLYVEEIGRISDSSEHCKGLSRLQVEQSTSTFNFAGVNASNPLWVTNYTKLDRDTTLKINLDFVAKISSASSAVCAAWYIHIDGNDCQPIPYVKIVALITGYGNIPGEHRSVEVEGHCSNISAGLHEISLQVTTCPLDSYGVGDVETGWGGTVQRLIVEEYRPQSNVKAVISPDGVVYKLPQFNIFTQSAFNINDGTDNGIVWVLESYTKLYSDSGLRLSLSAVGRNIYTSNACCRHYIVINNAECTNPGTIEGIHFMGNTATNLHQPIMIEGTCDGIPAGDVTLSINAGICKDQINVGDCYFGWDSYANIMISETYIGREIV